MPRISSLRPLASYVPPSKRATLGVSSVSPVVDYSTLGFSLRDVVGAIQEGESCSIVRAYLTHYSEIIGSETFKVRLDALVDGYPPFFFAVKTGNPEMVKLWACYSSNLDCTYNGIPLLAFAIGLCESFRKDMPTVVKTLLSLGAPVETIPRAFYLSLHSDLPDTGVAEGDTDDLHHEKRTWYSVTLSKRFSRALNFSFTI